MDDTAKIINQTTFTKTDFNESGWETIVSQADSQESGAFGIPFWQASGKAKAENNRQLQAVYALLSGITCPELQPEDVNKPFSLDYIVTIKDEHLAVLTEWAPEIINPELRARIADILWIRKRNIEMLRLAIDAYVESALEHEDPHHWTKFVFRVERALKLAQQANQRECIERINQLIEETLDKYQGEDPLYLSARLMEMLQNQKKGDFERYAAFADKSATSAEANQDWSRARRYLEIKARWHNLNKDTNNGRQTLIRAAELYIKQSEAEVAKNPPDNMAAAINVEKAIEAFRRIGKSRERVDELHGLLRQYQLEMMSDMRVIEIPRADVSEAIHQAQQHVTGKSLLEAVSSLALISKSPPVETLRQQAASSAEKYTFYHMISETLVTQEGEVTARKSSMLSSNPEEVEKAARAEMHRWASIHRQTMVSGLIEPARYQINLEHFSQIRDWFEILINNPFVPPGREYLYAKGLQAGLEGDFIVAAHILIPQLEHSLLYLLIQHGVIPTRLTRNLIQDKYLLHEILYFDELKDILTEDIIFDMQGLLINRFGSNLRNKLSHGLAELGELTGVESIYFWWLILHLCCCPIIYRHYRERAEQSEPTIESTSEGTALDNEPLSMGSNPTLSESG